MGKYQAYPEYKDSEVDWVGDIPLDWQVTRLKYVASIFGRIGFRGYTVNDIVGEGEGAIVLSPSNIVGDKFTLAKTSFLSWQKYYESPEIMVEKNDVLLVKTGSTYGKSTIVTDVESPMTINPQMALIKNTTIDPRFLAYLFNSSLIKAKIDVNNTGSGMPTMTQENINNFPIPRPNSGLDIQIANFLDHETAKIDTLIEKQQLLIKLLKEKRQAVISHAVTKGLNPQAPMKDSGVEWLGEVPEHWVVSRIKNFAKIDSGHTPSRQVEEYWIDCNIPWVSLNDSKTLKVVDYIDDTSNKINELGMANSSAHLLPERSVVFTRDASIGLSAIMSKPMAVSQHLIAWICNDAKLIPEFLLLIFYAMEKEFERYTFGATIKTIGMDDVRSLSGAFPPQEEQKVLVEWAFQKMASLKNGIDKAESVVDLLKERRTALISAAVTGKIDVRNWQRNRLTSEDECSDAV
ncbi:restriction endonuclease subunit S [Vibrio parahaemolyticus]|nr:restriction endonuclease subunit S [Vibrio parahaemolyticus]